MTEDFREWVLTKATNTTAEELVSDTHCIGRLMNDVLWGRSKRFNRTKANGKSQGLTLLEEEYKREGELMAQLVCVKCKGSLAVFKDKDGKLRYRCSQCGAEYTERPK